MCRGVKADDPATHYSLKTLESGGKQSTRKKTGTTYRIVVRSELSRRYAPAFEGMEMETKAEQTILTGEIIDQSHLHGVLDRIGALGLELVSVECMPQEPKDTAARPAADGRDEPRAEQRLPSGRAAFRRGDHLHSGATGLVLPIVPRARATVDAEGARVDEREQLAGEHHRLRHLHPPHPLLMPTRPV